MTQSSEAIRERISHVRLANRVILTLGIWFFCSTFIFDFGTSVGMVSHAAAGIVLIVLALRCLAAPLESAPISFASLIVGLWVGVSPFILGLSDTLLWHNFFAAVLIVLSAAFSISEASGANAPL